MDKASLKAVIDGLFAYAEGRATNPIVKIIEKEANVVLDSLIDQYLATLPTTVMLLAPTK